MCHLILLMPVLALPIFWLWPPAVTVPLYGVILVLSGAVYYYAVQAMRRPVQTGAEELLHSIGKVVGLDGRTLRVRVHSEIWNAESPDTLQEGDPVRVEGMEGLLLRVRRCRNSPDTV